MRAKTMIPIQANEAEHNICTQEEDAEQAEDTEDAKQAKDAKDAREQAKQAHWPALNATWSCHLWPPPGWPTSPAGGLAAASWLLLHQPPCPPLCQLALFSGLLVFGLEASMGETLKT